jgi:hypothetical protein
MCTTVKSIHKRILLCSSVAMISCGWLHAQRPKHIPDADIETAAPAIQNLELNNLVLPRIQSKAGSKDWAHDKEKSKRWLEDSNLADYVTVAAVPTPFVPLAFVAPVTHDLTRFARQHICVGRLPR